MKVLKTAWSSHFSLLHVTRNSKRVMEVSKESKEIVGNDKLFQIHSTRTGREDC